MGSFEKKIYIILLTEKKGIWGLEPRQIYILFLTRLVDRTPLFFLPEGGKGPHLGTIIIILHRVDEG